MTSYFDLEQTQAKHFILRRYLQALAFKVLARGNVNDDFSDTSLMIAIEVLKDAQARIRTETGVRRRILCFFSENDDMAYG